MIVILGGRGGIAIIGGIFKIGGRGVIVITGGSRRIVIICGSVE